MKEEEVSLFFLSLFVTRKKEKSDDDARFFLFSVRERDLIDVSHEVSQKKGKIHSSGLRPLKEEKTTKER